MSDLNDCSCTPSWPTLVAVIDDEHRIAMPSAEHSAGQTAADSEGTHAFCDGCGAQWPGNWTLAPTSPATTPSNTASKPQPKDAVELLRLFIGQRAGGEVRPQQEQMVAAVEKSIKNNEHLVIQAGTGTGKSFGYLIPSVAAKGKRIVISTATKQLGEQIVETDLPVLADLLPKVGGREFTYSLIMGRNNYACFGYDTQIMTYDGIRKIGECAGGTAKVLDGHGDWVDAEVRSFGTQEIVELTLSRSGQVKTVETTAEHRWFVQKSASSLDVKEMTTDQLQPGMRLQHVSVRPLVTSGKQIRPSTFGIAHGFTYGDGTTFAPTTGGFVTATVTLHGEKDKALLPYFNGSHTITVNLGDQYTADTAIRVCDLPNRFKRLPDLDEAPSYLYGWLAGYFAADGSVGDGATATLHSADVTNLEFVTSVCARLGIRHGEINTVERVGKNSNGQPSLMYSLSLSTETLTDEFFVIEAHRANVTAYRDAMTYKRHKAGRRWKVESVRATGRQAEVFCAVVPTTESFVLAGNILTGNCRQKIHELNNLDEEAADKGITDALFDVETQQRASSARPSGDDLRALNSLLKWVDKTDSGSRSEAPAVPDKVWGQVSTDSAGCPGRSACSFGNDCFAEQAREQARESDVVVANHALVAQDLRSPQPMLGEYEVLVADEVHELESYLSSAWGCEVVASGIKMLVALQSRKLPKDGVGDKAKEIALKAVEDLDALAEMLGEVEAGLLPTLPDNIKNLLLTIADKLMLMASAFDRAAEKHGSTPLGAQYKGSSGKVKEAVEAINTVIGAGEGSVRWLETGSEKRGPALKTAPLWIGPALMKYLDTKTFIATSATITVGGSFDPMIRTLALTEPVETVDEDGLPAKPRPPRRFEAVDVGTPFEYRKQAMLYIPDDKTFPAPVGKDREAHSQAVLDECVALVQAAGGRTLALFTTTRAAKRAAEYMRDGWRGRKPRISTPVLWQGDAPPSQLLKEFAEVENATLCATMGFWHGVNVPGPSLQCVIMDKIPFAPMDDPLMSARRSAVETDGGDGFHQVYVQTAAIMLAQGAGRLVRAAGDKGVVAILDTRLITKRSYGPALIRSLPDMGLFRDRSVVESALSRLDTAAKSRSIPTQGTAGSPVRPAPKPSGRTVPEVKARKAAPRKASTRALSRNVRATGKPNST